MHNSPSDSLARFAPSDNSKVVQVLYVDDEPEATKVFKQMLELQGSFFVETASSVDEAFKKMGHSEFDVVVSDYMMPLKSGLDFLKQLRENGNTIPFILFTGQGREEVAIKALNLGADRYVNKIGKPKTVFGELAHSIRQKADKKRVEKQLKIVSSVVEQSSSSIVILNDREKIVYVNPKFLQLHNLRCNDVIGKQWEPWVADGTPLKEDGDNIRNTVFKQKKMWSKEIYNVVSSGETVWRRATIFPLVDAKGKVTHVVYSGEDITKQRKTEQTVWEREEHLRAIIASSPDSMIVTDVHGNITDCNMEALSLLEFPSKAEILGKDYCDLIVTEDQPKVRESIEELFKNGSINRFECSLITASGFEIPVDYSANILKDAHGNPVGAIGLARNITECKKAEEALRESEKRFRELSEMLPEVIFEADCRGVITFVNHEAYDKFGYSEEEFGKGLTTLQIIAAQDQQRVQKNFRKLVSGKEPGPNEYLALRKDGSTFPMIVNSTPVLRDGRVVGIRGVMVDFTEHMKTEKALKETLAKMEALNEKLGVVGKLTRHDTRNKLSVILNNVYLAKQQLPDSSSTDYLEEIESAVDQIEKIFEFSRMYQKLGTENLSDVDVKKSLEEAFLLACRSDQVELVNECEGLTVKADSLLRQLFYNLIDNSLKHGEKVTKIRVYCKKEPDKLQLIYEDNGVGIADNEKIRIFEEGYGKGTGYGLYLIQKTCDVYGWSILETGELGKGAQFTITVETT